MLKNFVNPNLNLFDFFKSEMGGEDDWLITLYTDEPHKFLHALRLYSTLSL